MLNKAFLNSPLKRPCQTQALLELHSTNFPSALSVLKEGLLVPEYIFVACLYNRLSFLIVRLPLYGSVLATSLSVSCKDM